MPTRGLDGVYRNLTIGQARTLVSFTIATPDPLPDGIAFAGALAEQLAAAMPNVQPG